VKRLSHLFWLVALIGLSPATALAQQSVAAQETTIPGGALVMVAYMALWVALGAYVVFFLMKLRRLHRDLRDLQDKVDAAFDTHDQG
jgi:CcmD family protein